MCQLNTVKQPVEPFVCARSQQSNAVSLDDYLKRENTPVGLFIGMEALGDGLTKENMSERTLHALEKWPDHSLEIFMVSMLIFSEMICGGCQRSECVREHVMKLAERFETMQNGMVRC